MSTAASTSQIVTLPVIPELYNPSFLDVLLPVRGATASVQKSQTEPRHPMMDALKASASLTLTENLSPAYSSTSSAVLDAFQTLKPYASDSNIPAALKKAWAEDPQLTLRLIWNSRSIHDGKGEKEVFYHEDSEIQEARIDMHIQRQTTEKVKGREQRIAANLCFHAQLVSKLSSDPRFRALYIAVARLYAERLREDISLFERANSLPHGEERTTLMRQISLAGKWAPTPGGSHDRPTNLATAIALILHNEHSVGPALSTSHDTELATAEAHVLRSFYQRWVLAPLRKANSCPEPLMSSNRWTEIIYTCVPSTCMKNNTAAFFKHDPSGFERYLESVESGKKTISGATLMPHEIVRAAMLSYQDSQYQPTPGKPSIKDIRKRLAQTQLRAIEAQWKTMIERVREAGTLDNALAICDVSGSMGFISDVKSSGHVEPILPAISLSLVLAQISQPPFANNFITFSAEPEFVQLDPSLPLGELVESMSNARWNMNTNLNAVFLELLLPLALRNNLKQEDMIKRLFVFSDMQFDASQPYSDANAESAWETNHDVIEKAFREAGYEMPEIVYWNLEQERDAFPVLYDRKGVAMMNGFSPAMLKVFLGEGEETEENMDVDDGWETVEADPVKNTKDEFNPINVMKKALAKKSFDGLVVVD
ncbi:hypothetical protein EW026_g5631 [Hermanssonia centrifuga]|uniref:Uncharacterized protein n=1 Tax=Hermanssonia centrifuga TaxID=98765 RepID=A0A4S4KDJ2_9APHY|nr:hypothetical protein EW026_g5631 [Hermanssonia centrifuga]